MLCFEDCLPQGLLTSLPLFRVLFALDLSFVPLQHITVDASMDTAATTSLGLTSFSPPPLLLFLYCFKASHYRHTRI